MTFELFDLYIFRKRGGIKGLEWWDGSCWVYDNGMQKMGI